MKNIVLALGLGSFLALTLTAAEETSAPIVQAEKEAGAAIASGIPGIVNASMLNVRSAPDRRSPVIGKIRKETKVTVTGMVGNWAEIEAPEGTSVYVSGVYVRDGKTLARIQMRSAPAQRAPILGYIPANTQVKVIADAKYGWLQIAPPASLKVYVAKFYLDFDASALKPAPVQEKMPAPEAVKTEPPKAAAPAASTEKLPVPPAASSDFAEVKTDTDAEAAKAAVTAPAAPAPAKDSEPAETPEKAPAPTEAVKATLPAAAPVMTISESERANQNQALREIGADPAKPEKQVTVTGKLISVKSTNAASKYAILLSDSADFVFVCAGQAPLTAPYLDTDVTAAGELFNVPEWKHQVLRLDRLEVGKK